MGVSIRHAFNVLFDDFQALDLRSHGINVPHTEGDTDGCVGVILHRSKIWRCGTDGGWGLNHNPSSGVNEFSYLEITGNSTFVECGQAVATPVAWAAPTSGGIRWKGQAAKLETMSFVLCHNTAFFVPGGAGTPLMLTMDKVTTENCGRNDFTAAIYIEGIRGLIINDADHRNSDANKAYAFLRLDATSSGIIGVRVRDAQIQATSGNNPFEAYSATGSNLQDVSIRDTQWRAFDFAGQTRFGAGIYAANSVDIVDNDLTNQVARGFVRKQVVTAPLTTANPSYSPDVRIAERFIINLNAGASGTFTLAMPTSTGMLSSTLNGREMHVTIRNNTGATINLAYGVGTVGAPTTLAAGATRSCSWFLDRLVGWTQYGAWI